VFEWVGITIVQYQGMSLMYRNTISASILRHSLAFSFSESCIKWWRCVQFMDDARKRWRDLRTCPWRVISIDMFFIRIVWGGRGMSPIAGWVNWCQSAAFRIIWSCRPFEQPNKTPQLPICSPCAVQNNVSCSFWDQFLPGAMCQPVGMTRNGHYWNITPDLWLSQKESRFFPLASHFWAFSRSWLWPGLCEEHFCKIWRGAEDYCMKERGFGDSLFRLDWGVLHGRVSQFEMWQDGPCSFFRAHKACRRGSEPQLLLDFSLLSLTSPLGFTHIFLSYIFCCLPSGYVLAGLLLLQSTTWIWRSWLSGVIKVLRAVWLYLYLKT